MKSQVFFNKLADTMIKRTDTHLGDKTVCLNLDSLHSNLEQGRDVNLNKSLCWTELASYVQSGNWSPGPCLGFWHD